MRNPSQTGTLVLAHDVGATGNKTCLYRIGDRVELITSFIAEYPMHALPNGGVEQDCDDWWQAVCTGTREVLRQAAVEPAEIAGMAFCSQLQGFVPVGEDGSPLRRAMIYLDGHAQKQIEQVLYRGRIRFNGWNARITLQSLIITGGLAATAKDPLWKYHWMRENEPELFRRLYKWLDVKDYLILRTTGQYSATPDSAHLTWLFDTRPNHFAWSPALCKVFMVNADHLPPVVAAINVAGEITEAAARELGLLPDIPVFGSWETLL